VRACQTARALRAAFETSPALAVGSGARALLGAAGWPGTGRRTVVLVGHQPTLGEAAALALAGSVQPWSLKKGALVWLEHRSRGGEAETVLRAAISPDLL
jgi:phosphohistidine phosphatase